MEYTKLLKTPEDSPTLKDACKILKLIGIEYFLFYVNRLNGEDITFTNRPDFTEKFISDHWYKKSAFTRNPDEYEPGFYWYDEIENPDITAWINQHTNNVLTWINPMENACELMHFGTNTHKKDMISFYLNHIDLIKRFIVFFKNQISQEMKSNSKPLIFPNRIEQNAYAAPQRKSDSQDTEQFFQATKIKKFFLDAHYGNEHLTAKECELLNAVTSGLSAHEIGKILNLSPRTVENHIANLKSKLDVRSKSELILVGKKCFMLQD